MATIFNQAKATHATIHGADVKIPSGAKWVVSEGDDYTQVALDKPGHVLDGLTICLDWSQGFVRPDRKQDRVEAIIYDADLIEAHGADMINAE